MVKSGFALLKVESHALMKGGHQRDMKTNGSFDWAQGVSIGPTPSNKNWGPLAEAG